jgi:hypothetical protein
MKSVGEVILEVQGMLRSISEPPSTRFMNWKTNSNKSELENEGRIEQDTHIFKTITVVARQLKSLQKRLNIRMVWLCRPNYCSVEHFACKVVVCSLISGSKRWNLCKKENERNEINAYNDLPVYHGML